MLITFHCKQTMCVSCVNGKSDRGNASEIQAVCNNRKNWFFKCHSFLTILYKLKITECEHQYGARKTMLNLSFKFMYLLNNATADAASCSTFAAFILIPEENKPKIWMHINTCLSSAKVIPIQEVQKLLCVDAAASDAEDLCMWCMASLVDIFWEILFQNLRNNSARLKQYTKQRFNNKQTVEK